MSIDRMADGSRAPAGVVAHREALLARFNHNGMGSAVTASWTDGLRPLTGADIDLVAHEADAIIAATRRSTAAWSARRARDAAVTASTGARQKSQAVTPPAPRRPLTAQERHNATVRAREAVARRNNERAAKRVASRHHRLDWGRFAS